MAVWPNGSHSIPTVTSEFSPNRRNPVTGVVQPHNGIDLVGWDVVRAPFSGTIIFAGYNGGAGNEVRIQGDNGDFTRLLHNRAFIRTGGRVSEGEAVAYMGTTGQSTGKHCHFETHRGRLWNAVNPRDYMGSNGGGGGPANVAAGQRTAKTVVNRRKDASSQAAIAGDPLQPGTVGNFTGWKHGENVEGNNVWYQGISGDWFWSGGFHEGANGTGLKDLNPAKVEGNQRVVGGNTANRRIGAPSTSAPTGEALAPGTVGNFTHWTRGDSVDGNNVWFKGISGDYFWSGGFVGGANTAGLPEEVRNTAPSVGAQQRKATADLNGRSDANTSAGIIANLANGVVGDFNGWKRGQNIEGEDRWLRGAHSGAWFSLKFLTPANVDNLPEVTGSTPTPTPKPTPSVPENDPDPKIPLPKGINPRSAWTSEPIIGDLKSEDGTRPIVYISKDRRTQVAVHWDGGRNPTSVQDEINLVKAYERYHRTSAGGDAGALKYNFWVSSITGEIYEGRGYGMRAMAVGGANTQTISIIVPGGPGNLTEAAKDGLRRFYKITNEVYGKKLAQKVHKDINTDTSCPGPDITAWVHGGGLESPIIVDPTPTDPGTPEPQPEETVPVSKSWLESIYEKLKGLLKK